jgi:hypothetical protein
VWHAALLSNTLERAALLTKAWLPSNLGLRIHY